MTESTEVVLKKHLALSRPKKRTENEIKAVRSALTALGVDRTNLAGRRLRKPMTAAERKSVSKRMKVYWAKKRAQKHS